MTGTQKSKSVAISIWGKCLKSNPLDDEWLFPTFLSDCGIELLSMEDPNANFYAALDYSALALRQVRRIPRERRLLIAFEPRAVNPSQHTKKTRNKFAKTFVMSPRQLILSSDSVIQLGPFSDPHKIRSYVESNSQTGRVNEIALLNENKFSFVTGNQYKMRWHAVMELAKAGYVVNIGGKNWNKTLGWHLKEQALTLAMNLKAQSDVNLANFHGPLRHHKNLVIWGRVDDGLEFLSRYRFALAIENDPDYLSEKLLNAIAAGCIPIYVGADLQHFDIPPNVAIRVDGSPGSFTRAMESLTSEGAEEILHAGRKWLETPGVIEFWSHDAALMNMAVAIRDFVERDTD